MVKLWLDDYLILIRSSSPYISVKFVNKAKNNSVLLLISDDKETSARRAHCDPV